MDCMFHFYRKLSNSYPSQGIEKGYPWLFFYSRRSWRAGLAVTLIVIGLCGVFYVWYRLTGNDTSPKSTAGLVYAAIGTLFLILAAALYSLQRRSRKRAIGQLNAALNWHVFFAITGLVILLMHSFGHFEAVSGTYAFFAMLVLSLSGLAGRALDHFMPRLIAREVDKVLTSQGDDRIDVVSQKLQAIVVHNNQQVRGFKIDDSQPTSVPAPSTDSTSNSLPLATGSQPLRIPWDLAYISLEPTQQELDRDAPHHRFVPDKKSALTRPEVLMPGTQEQISKLQSMHLAMQREQFYRYVVRYWRVLHVLLALITVGLVIWHIIFALSLMFPGLFR